MARTATSAATPGLSPFWGRFAHGTAVRTNRLPVVAPTSNGGGEPMPGKKRAHYRGDYHINARRVRHAASVNPHAICWRCGLTLEQHEPHRNGKRPKWTAGHTIDSVVTSLVWLDVTRRPPPGAWLAPEASTCNSIHGGLMRDPILSSGYDW